jgi:hypothetical protein
LGFGFSTLTWWKRRCGETDLLAGSHEGIAKQLTPQRKGHFRRRWGRFILKRTATYFSKELPFHWSGN